MSLPGTHQTAEIARLPVCRSLEAERAGVLAERAINEISEAPKRIATGVQGWDLALKGGLLVPSLNILGAKPKCGKSTIMTYIADQAVQSGNIVYMVDMENGGNRIFRRIIAQKAKVAIDEFFAGEPLEKDIERVNAVTRELVEGQLGQRLYLTVSRQFDDKSLEERICYLAGQAQAIGKEMLLIIDSLQKLPMNLSDRRSGIDGWLRWMEAMRDKYQIAILCTSELKRPQEGQVYKPTEIAFKESGDVEYAADLAITLDRASANDHWIDDAPEQDPIKCSVVFNRDGPSGRLRSDLLLKYPFHEIVEVPAVTIPKAPVKRF